MAESTTKKRIIQRHQANEHLQALRVISGQRSPHDLSLDHPTTQPDPDIIESATRALEAGNTHYAPVPGIAPLRQALTLYLQDLGLSAYGPEEVQVTAGMQEGRFLLIQMLANSYTGLGLPAVVHPGARMAAGVRPLEVTELPVDSAKGMLPTLAGLRVALEAGCKLLYLESPVRLTGVMYDAAAVAEIAAMVKHFEAAVIWDQGLAPWVLHGDYVSLGAQEGLAQQVAVCGEAWPGVGLESWFIGYLAANQDWLGQGGIRSQKQLISICTSTPSQYAALEAATIYAKKHQEQIETLAHHRQEAVAIARKIGLDPLPGASVHLMALPVSNGTIQREKLQAAGFEVVDGHAFGAPDVLRLTITFDNTIHQALSNLNPAN